MNSFDLKLDKGDARMVVQTKNRNVNFLTKVLILLTTTLILSVGLGIYLGYEFGFETTAEASLKDKVKSSNIEDLENTVDNAGVQIVDLARDIGIVVAIIVILWAAYSLLIKKSAEGLADMKGRMGVLLIAIGFIFFTEQILGAILGLFGVEL